MAGIRPQNLRQVAALSALLALALGPAVPLRASEEAVKKIEGFKKRFVGGSPDVRAGAVEDLTGSDDLQITRRIVEDAFNDQESVVNLAGVKVLSGIKDPASIDWLITPPLKSDKAQVRYLTVETLTHLTDARVNPALMEALKDGNWLTVASAVRGLAARKVADAAPALLPLLENKDQRLRVVAADALAELKAPGAGPALAKLLDGDKEWRVKVAAAEGLVKLKFVDGLATLKRQRQTSEGRIKDDLAQAIKALTPADPAGDDKGTDDYKDYDLKYYGVGSNSKRLLFIIDCSDSMKTPMGLSAKKVDLEEGCESTRLGIVQSELIRALNQLQKSAGAKFNIIFVHTQNDVWQKTMVPATPEKVGLAIKHVKRQKASGRTNLCDALCAALAIEDGGAIDLKDADLKEDPDTIFVLSDGEPNDGKYKRMNDILDAVRDVNQYARVRIHSIGTGDSNFLKELAKQNGGSFVSKLEF